MPASRTIREALAETRTRARWAHSRVLRAEEAVRRGHFHEWGRLVQRAWECSTDAYFMADHAHELLYGMDDHPLLAHLSPEDVTDVGTAFGETACVFDVLSTALAALTHNDTAGAIDSLHDTNGIPAAPPPGAQERPIQQALYRTQIHARLAASWSENAQLAAGRGYTSEWRRCRQLSWEEADESSLLADQAYHMLMTAGDRPHVADLSPADLHDVGRAMAAASAAFHYAAAARAAQVDNNGGGASNSDDSSGTTLPFGDPDDMVNA